MSQKKKDPTFCRILRGSRKKQVLCNEAGKILVSALEANICVI